MNEQIVERMAKAARNAWPLSDLNVTWEEIPEAGREAWRVVISEALDAGEPGWMDEYVRGLEATVSRLTAERVTSQVSRDDIRPIIAKVMSKIANPELIQYNRILNNAVEDIYRLMNKEN